MYLFRSSLEVDANRKNKDVLFHFSLLGVFLEITYTANYSLAVVEK